MQPNDYSQPSYSPPSSPAGDPYAFLNQTNQSPSPLNLIKGKSFKTKMLLIIFVFLVIVIILAIVKSILSSNNALNMPSMYAVLSSQQEINTLASTGTQSSTSQSYLNFSYTALATSATNETKLSSLLNANGYKLNPALIVTQPNLTNQLTQAQQNSTFDATYGPIISAQLQNYRTVLVNAYKLNKSPVIREYLNTDYQNAGLLIKMFKSSYG